MSFLGGGGSDTQSSSLNRQETITRQPILDFRSGSTNSNLAVGGGGSRITSGLNPDFDNRLRRLQQVQSQNAGGLNALSQQLQAPNSAFLDAVSRPAEANAARQVAASGQNFARRGIFGSLPQNVIGQQRGDFDQGISDIRMRAQNALLGPAIQAAIGSGQLTGESAGLLQQRINNEFGLQGLNLQALQLAQANQLPTGSTVTGTETTRTRSNPGLLGGLGQLATIGGALAGGPIGGAIGSAVGSAFGGGSSPAFGQPGGGFFNPNAMGLGGRSVFG